MKYTKREARRMLTNFVLEWFMDKDAAPLHAGTLVTNEDTVAELVDIVVYDEADLLTQAFMKLGWKLTQRRTSRGAITGVYTAEKLGVREKVTAALKRNEADMIDQLIEEMTHSTVRLEGLLAVRKFLASLE